MRETVSSQEKIAEQYKKASMLIADLEGVVDVSKVDLFGARFTFFPPEISCQVVDNLFTAAEQWRQLDKKFGYPTSFTDSDRSYEQVWEDVHGCKLRVYQWKV